MPNNSDLPFNTFDVTSDGEILEENPFDTDSADEPEGDSLSLVFDELAVDSSNDIQQAPPMFTVEENEAFAKWMSGAVSEPPAVVRTMTTNLATRAGWGLSFQVVQMFDSLNKGAEFIRACENKLFDPTNLNNFTPYGEEIQNLYKLALNSQEKRQEFIRKFIVQNRDILDMTSHQDPNPEVTEMVKLLSDLPKEKLQAFLKELTAEPKKD